ncbi:MAG: asparagine synthetase B [Minwuia thermotolerans]|nr:MAG: asparagine synthetase B [Minwuia thermotolerans]
MIGLYALWHDPDAVLSRAAAFATAFRVGDVLPRASLRNGALLCDGYAAPDHEPARTPDGSAVLLYGFIENRARCRAELGVEAPGDAAIYAAGYARWGEDVDQRLTGEYATILVEANGKRVRIARSPIKSPALYFRRDRERLIATTAVQAIFSTGEIARELDEQKIADTLYLNYMEERRAWFRGVTRLPRGTRAWFTPDGVTETGYYRIEDIPPVRLKRDSDYVDAADALFREATEAALEGFERPAVSLSGGLDSQAVAAYTMLGRPGQPLLSFTSVPQAGWKPADPNAFVDERPHVEALAAMYPQLVPRWVDTTGRNARYHQQEFFEAAMTAPRNVENLHWMHQVAKDARGAGADVLLSGAMGNRTFSFSGSGMLQDLVRQGHVLRLARELLAAGPVGELPRSIVREVILPFVPAGAERWIRKRFGRLARSPLESWSALHPDFAQEYRVEERAAELGYDPTFRPITSVLDYRLAVMGNAASEAGDIYYGLDRLHGISSRDPTAYRPLLEFCFGIPLDQYLNRGRKRWLARRLLADKVPDMVLHEQRRGRQAADWPRRIRDQRQDLLQELEWLSSDPLVSGYLNIDRLRTALENMPDDDSRITHHHQQTLSIALNRGLGTVRFVRFINGRNDI